MAKELKITIEEIDYYVVLDWSSDEFPVVSDFVRIMELCNEEQREEFSSMPLPNYLHANFPSTKEYIHHYRWQVVERCWQSSDCLAINCRRVDPMLA